MEKEHEWIYEYDSLTINSNLYYFRCVWSFDKKAPNDNKPSMQLVFNIWNDTKEIWVDWNDFKGSYLSEKFTDYVKNTLNGKRSCYMKHDDKRNFN